jgi:hypothetical protein
MALGSVISLVAVAAGLPQPLSLLLDRDQDVSGLSPARWRLGAGSCATWVSYGWLIEQPMVYLSAGFGLVCAVVICAVLHVRRTAPPDDAQPVVVATGRRTVGRVSPAQAPALGLAAA